MSGARVLPHLEQNIDLPTIVIEDGVPKEGKLFDKAYSKLEIDYGNENKKFLLRYDEVIDSKIELNDKTMAPLKKGEKVGKIIYYSNDVAIAQYPIVAVEDVNQRSVSWIFDKILQMYLGIEV